MELLHDTTLLKYCTFTSNSVYYVRNYYYYLILIIINKDGGAIFFYASTGTCNIVNCNFVSNSQSYNAAYYGGGAIINDASTFIVYGSSFSSNSAYYGGAIYNYAGTSTVYKPYTFTSNTARASSSYND